MNRKFFTVELRRAIIPLGAVSGVTLAVLWGLERFLIARGESPSTAGSLVDQLILGGLLVLAVVGGERCFGRQSTERTMGLLDTVPMSRWLKWVHIVLPHALVICVCTVVAITLRPSLITAKDTPLFLAGVLILQVLAYATGCCCSIVFGRPVVAYMVGMPVVCAALIETSESLTDAKNSTALWIWLVGAIAPLVFLCFGMSLVLFVRGDLAVARTRTKNAVFFFGCLALFAIAGRFAVWGMCINAGWVMERYWPSEACVASADGKRVSVIDELAVNRSVRRLTFVDAERGTKLGRFVGRNVQILGWSGDGARFIASGRDSSVSAVATLFMPETRSVLTIDPSGRVRSRIPIGELIPWRVARTSGGGYAIVIVGDTRRQSVTVGTALLVDSDGTSYEMLPPLEIDRRPRIHRLPEGILLDFSNQELSNHYWLLADGSSRPKDVTAEFSEPGIRTPCNDRELPGVVIAESGIDAHEAALIGTGPTEGIYLYSPCTAVRMPVYHVADIEARHDLRVRHVDGQWETVAQGIGGMGLRLWEANEPRDLGVAHDPHSGVIAFYEERDGDRRAVLYDPWLRKRVVLQEIPSGIDQHWWIDIEHFAGTRDPFVGLNRRKEAFEYLPSEEDARYYYNPSTGEAQRVQIHEPTDMNWLLYHDPAGATILGYEVDESGFPTRGSGMIAFDRISGDGDSMRLWPLID